MKKLHKRDGKETRNNKNTAAANRHGRLSSAREALEKLKSREKIPEGDRSSMALNLGKMIIGAQKREKALTFSRLFREAFGEERGVSFFKKKDRLICMPGQQPGKTHYSMGLHYLELLKALIKYIELPEGQSDEEQYSLAVMRLIEGTSYDYKGGHADRAKVEYRKELDKHFEKLVEPVLKEINLNWMREWTKDHPVSVKGPTGVAIDMKLQSHNNFLGLGTLDIGGPTENCLAPCVRIARLYYAPEVSDYLDVEVKKNVSNVSVCDIQEAVSHLVGEENLGDLDYYDDASDQKLAELLRHEDWQKSSRMRFEGIRVKMLLDIELRYDEDLAKWKPLLLLRRPQIDGSIQIAPSSIIVSSRGDGLMEDFTREGRSVYQVFCLGSDITPVYAIEDKASEKVTTYKIFVDENYLEFGPPDSFFLGHDSECCFYPTDSDFYDFMLTPLDRETSDTEVCSEIGQVKIDPALTGFVKAPANTMAYAILQNMAYAPERERIDQLLLKDAKEKYQKLKKLSEIGEREYEEAIGRL